MIYSTGNTHLLSAILTRVTGASTWDFANQHLARPMGFSLARWLRDPQGIYFGGNDMTMTPRQILAFGELYINGGRANGEQVVPESWIRDSLVARTASPREQGRFYGYGWWIRPMGGHAVYYAWGYGGQFVFVVPTLDLVVVTTSDSDPGPERQQHLRRIYELVEYEVVGPLSAGGPETVHAVPATRQAIE
jgi:CubicO group peptidase (beta-lactamase class C family)